MALAELLDPLFADFGLPVSAGGITGLGILDAPGVDVANGNVWSTDYSLKVQTAVFGSVLDGATVTVNGLSYQARRDAEPIDDGAISVIWLQRFTFVVYEPDVYRYGVFS